MKCLHTGAQKVFHANKGFTYQCENCGFETKLQDYENDAWDEMAADRNNNAKLNIKSPYAGKEYKIEAAAATSKQVGGNHYTKLKIQPLEYALENNMGICEHAVVKYITRWKDKGGVEDLQKAKHYIDILIERSK